MLAYEPPRNASAARTRSSIESSAFATSCSDWRMNPGKWMKLATSRAASRTSGSFDRTYFITTCSAAGMRKPRDPSIASPFARPVSAALFHSGVASRGLPSIVMRVSEISRLFRCAPMSAVSSASSSRLPSVGLSKKSRCLVNSRFSTFIPPLPTELSNAPRNHLSSAYSAISGARVR